MAVIISAEEAAELIQDGDVVVFAADGLVSFPNEIVDAAERRISERRPSGKYHEPEGCRNGKFYRYGGARLVS